MVCNAEISGVTNGGYSSDKRGYQGTFRHM